MKQSANVSRPAYILPVIVFSQFCCTSLWFAGNAVMSELTSSFGLPASALPHLTSAVQFGFISGTLLFALLTISDRFSPSRVFLFSALAGAFFNVLTIAAFNTFGTLIAFRFMTGFFLAGIYPVGMKIAADYYSKGLGKSLGFLVGALVLGTAFPHLLSLSSGMLPWKYVLGITSGLAIAGGVAMILLVPDGPFRTAGKKPDLSAFFRVFRNRDFRAAAFGYFGHMWELYAFWAFVPVMLSTFNKIHPEDSLPVSLWSFIIIGAGSLSCVAGGILSLKTGTARPAFVALLTSAFCCLISPIAFHFPESWLFAAFLLVWGLAVIMDSPLFSTLVAGNADSSVKGTALTIVNCIGFAITIFSIQSIHLLEDRMGSTYVYLLLAAGPFLGLYALIRRMKFLS